MYPKRSRGELRPKRRYLLRLVALACSLFFLLPASALAWHEAAHRATAAIAFEQLRADERKRIVQILRQHPRYAEDFLRHMPDGIATADDDAQGAWLLQQASIWPDLIRRLGEDVRRQYNNSRWHYINLLVWLTPEDEAALADSIDANRDTAFEPPLRQSLNIVQALRGNIATWRDPAATDAQKAVALCWVLHLVGDLHQPLHTVALFSRAYFPSGDRGGNSINVVRGDETRNLHAVWDGLPTGMGDLGPTTKTRQLIENDIVNDAAIDAWLHQHADLARRFVYTDDLKSQLLRKLEFRQSPVVNLSDDYLDAARSLARRQVNLAGHRMAELLLAES